MARKRRIKKSALLMMAIILFFIVYFVSFTLFAKSSKDDEENTVNIEKQEDNRPLLKQLEDKTKIYLSDSVVSDVRIEEELLEELRYSFEDLSKIRTPSSFKPTYEGYSDDGIKFSTDLNVMRIYTVDKEEYYKVPVNSKDEFKKILDRSIYTSFDFIKQYKTWKSVEITYKNNTKSISGWKYDDLANTMVAKRLVGKVQPEKDRQRSKYNFKIKIKADNYEAIIDTMGSDYVKIKAKNLTSYYEVHTALFDYIKTTIFELK